jgi:hypothetical protein
LISSILNQASSKDSRGYYLKLLKSSLPFLTFSWQTNKEKTKKKTIAKSEGTKKTHKQARK